ncbi:carbohydrate-binding module family 21 protein [Phanerochaete carnosa HHB-10118-sp]|uniref:Carbohydrate-binding module family 21 protein n=1 Tax=Phanerochaete carnosa (strain HHB-10118-sp) TaxID=650164 RepID=K5WQT9_PHACS|nr:carbohydrate-binding module family 21 protein [Phanerochaete carnosa HHB-10118-sp]EKM61810.1 carbohydrate-binding module family 21 protein [Phanerochaete carnosa HHB-10118-sp]
MPYFSPADPSPSSSSTTATTATTSHARSGHRRTRSSFSDERGPGAFAPMGNLPRRRSTNEHNKKAVFHLNVDEDSPPDDDHSPSSSPPKPPHISLPAVNSLRLSMESGRFSPTVNPPAHIEIPKTGATFSTTSPNEPLSNVPFPTSSPISPTDRKSPFISDRSPSGSSTSTSSIPRTPSTPIILSNGRPLKPSLKSSSSSPNVAGDFADGMRRHFRVQSAPSTPRVHFAEEGAGLEMVKVFSRSGKPASLSKPAGEETETETEAEYPFPSLFPTSSFGGSFMSSGSPSPGTSSPSQLIHELDTTPGVTSPIPTANPSPHANIHLETVTLPKTRPPTLRGTVLVRNIHFEKNVVVRFTLDDWQTTSEVVCKHVVSLPGLPPPFPRPHTIGDYAGQIAEGRAEESASCQWDRFSCVLLSCHLPNAVLMVTRFRFTIRLEDYEPKLSERTLFLVARFVACSGHMGEFWDNNDGQNYRIGFKKASAPTNSPLSTPRAPPIQVSASFPPSFSREKKAASFSAVPHVSTFGPTRHVAHKQQPTFNAPSSMRFTPTTTQSGSPAPVVLSKIAVSNGKVVTSTGDDDVGEGEEDVDEKDEAEGEEKQENVVVPVVPPVPVSTTPSPPSPLAQDKTPVEREVEESASSTKSPADVSFSDRAPLIRRHSAIDHTPRFPLPGPIVVPKYGQHSRGPPSDGSKPTSPVEAYISKRLTLRNYVAPGSTPSSTMPSPELPRASLPEARAERSSSASPNGIVTPPTTPPRETHLKGLPDVAATEADEEKEDAQAMLSPLVMTGTCSFNSEIGARTGCSPRVCMQPPRTLMPAPSRPPQAPTLNPGP